MSTLPSSSPILMDVARVLRSKNAGAFVLTIDIMFHETAMFEHAVNENLLNAKTIASLYHIPHQRVQVINYPQVKAIKVTLPRQNGSGDVGDTDVYGAQQHVPLMYLPIPI